MCSENKGADQLRSYCEADLHLCFHIGRLLVFLMQRLMYKIDSKLNGYEFQPGLPQSFV